MAYTNWKDHGQSFLDFTEELTYEWMRNGFDRKQAKEWLSIGMKKEDAGFCAWLRDEVKIDALEVLDNMNIESSYQEKDLREQHKEYLKNDRLSKEVVEKIKDFEKSAWNKETSKFEFTQEQQSLIDKLIFNQELKERYQEYGLCSECRQPNTSNN